MTYGEHVTLTCAVVAGGGQSYTFQLEVPMESTSLTRGTVTNGTDFIRLTFSATAEDDGTYQCTASDGQSMLTGDDTLTVGKV